MTVQRVKARAQARHHRDQVHHQPSELWLSSRDAMARVGNKTLKGWYEWRKRHGVATDGMGRVLLRDLEQALLVRRQPGRPSGPARVMAPSSLANLALPRQSHGAR